MGRRRCHIHSYLAACPILPHGDALASVNSPEASMAAPEACFHTSAYGQCPNCRNSCWTVACLACMGWSSPATAVRVGVQTPEEDKLAAAAAVAAAAAAAADAGVVAAAADAAADAVAVAGAVS